MPLMRTLSAARPPPSNTSPEAGSCTASPSSSRTTSPRTMRSTPQPAPWRCWGPW
uniref:Uncharacterized protein n=1 Tax=Triticum urartu TaxID=4572 RepID=A0A8R7TBV4_TRIUA